MADRIPLMEIGTLQARLGDLKAKKGAPPWSEAMVMTDDIQAFIICHAPGHPNDTHYHLHDEWWVVLQGEIDWYIEGAPAPIHARAGDFVFGPKNLWHHVAPVGSEPTIRVAINARGDENRRKSCSSARMSIADNVSMPRKHRNQPTGSRYGSRAAISARRASSSSSRASV